MTTETATCPHGRSIYREQCTSCEYQARQYQSAKKAYDTLSHDINGGADANVLGVVFGEEHPYLLNKLAEAMAYGVLLRTYDRLCLEPTIYTGVEPHPEHDGRLSCGTVIGAMRTLATKRDDDQLKARKFWLDRVYERPY